MNMKYRILILLICMICTATIIPPMAADNYMGGEIVLGSGSSGTIKITEMTTPVNQQAMGTVPPTALPLTGSFSVTTTPAGATVFIDGVQKGISPATLSDLTPGAHTLLLRMNGYADLSVPVTIIAGQTQTYSSTMLPATTQLPAMPANKKTPGFEAVPGIAALGTVLLVKKTLR
jgi:hypothetical protein